LPVPSPAARLDGQDPAHGDLPRAFDGIPKRRSCSARIKTLASREAPGENALAIAKFWKSIEGRAVHYPGLASHPDHKLAKRQMRGFGSMLAFDLKGGLAARAKFCDSVRRSFSPQVSAAFESLVVLPIYSSHYNMSLAELEKAHGHSGNGSRLDRLEDPPI